MDTAREGDFDAYVRAGAARHKRLAFLLTGDLDEAEDLLQAAYARVLPRWTRITAGGDPDAYVRRVMVNLRTSWWRRHRGRESPAAEPEDTRRSRDLAADHADLDLLLEALRRLPARQRTAVVLRHYCDLSEADTAAAMGIGVGGVKSQTSKGLAALRAALATDGATDTEEAAR